jgi:predicted O-methyltransferase YrrM
MALLRKRRPQDSPAESVPTALGGQLDQELRRDLEEVTRSIAVDDGGGASVLKIFLLAELIVAEQLTRIVEIGVYRGRLFIPLARLMSRLERGEVVGIDPYSADAAVQRDVQRAGIDLIEWPTTIDWDGLHREVTQAIERWDLAGHARLIRQRSEDAADGFADTPIDMLHVDGNHDRDAVVSDLERFLPHLKDGGLLVMDDIAWPSVRPLYENLAREHELLFSLVESGVYLWPAGGANDFAVLRVRK